MWWLLVAFVYAQDPNRPPGAGENPSHPGPRPPAPTAIPDPQPMSPGPQDRPMTDASKQLPLTPPVDPATITAGPPVDTVNGQPMVYRLEDPDKKFVGTPVVRATQAGEDPRVYVLRDDGTGSDAVAGDHVWASFASLHPGELVELELRADSGDGTVVYRTSTTLDGGSGPMQAVFKYSSRGVTLDTQQEAAAVSKVPPVDGAADRPAPAAARPAPAASPPPLFSLPELSGTSPVVGLMGLLTVSGLGWMAWRWRGRLLVVAPSIPSTNAFGMEIDSQTVWVFPAADVPEIVRAAVTELAVQRPILLVSNRKLEGIGHVWRTRLRQPSPTQLRKAIEASGGFVVLERLDSLEAPLDDEGAAAVVEEFLSGYREPLLMVLGDGDAVPHGVRPLRWIREGELLLGPNRLQFQDGRWRKTK